MKEEILMELKSILEDIKNLPDDPSEYEIMKIINNLYEIMRRLSAWQEGK